MNTNTNAITVGARITLYTSPWLWRKRFGAPWTSDKGGVTGCVIWLTSKAILLDTYDDIWWPRSQIVAWEYVGPAQDEIDATLGRTAASATDLNAEIARAFAALSPPAADAARAFGALGKSLQPVVSDNSDNIYTYDFAPLAEKPSRSGPFTPVDASPTYGRIREAIEKSGERRQADDLTPELIRQMAAQVLSQNELRALYRGDVPETLSEAVRNPPPVEETPAHPPAKLRRFRLDV